MRSDARVLAHRFELRRAKRVVHLAVPVGEVGHVLHEANNWHCEFAKHVDALLDVHARKALRRGDHERGAQPVRLAQRQLHVARAWWQVDKQVVEIAPFGT